MSKKKKNREIDLVSDQHVEKIEVGIPTSKKKKTEIKKRRGSYFVKNHF